MTEPAGALPDPSAAGGVLIPLPGGRRGPLGPAARAAAVRSAAADLAAMISRLRREVSRSRVELDELRGLLAERERSLLAVEQRAFAEEMLRLELAHERGRLAAELLAERRRASELEARLEDLRRRADEAEHLAAAARHATGAVGDRQGCEPKLEPAPSRPAVPPEWGRLDAARRRLRETVPPLPDLPVQDTAGRARPERRRRLVGRALGRLRRERFGRS